MESLGKNQGGEAAAEEGERKYIRGFHKVEGEAGFWGCEDRIRPLAINSIVHCQIS